MPLLDSLLSSLARGLLALAAAACAAILALVVAAVVMRYALSAPLRFTEELSGLLLAQMVFLAMPFTLTANQNIRVTLLTERLDARVQRMFWMLGQIILAAFCLVFAWNAWKITAFTLNLSLKSEQARLPLAPWLIAMTSLVALCAFIAVWQTLRPPPATKPPVL